MILNNLTQEKVTFAIGTSNGREIEVDNEPSSFSITGDLQKYRPPFNVLARIDGAETSPIEGIGDRDVTELCINLFKKGQAYELITSFGNLFEEKKQS